MNYIGEVTNDQQPNYTMKNYIDNRICLKIS